MAEREYTDLIVIHCSATKPSMMHVNEDEIRQWHMAKGWEDAGYNLVIPRKPAAANTGWIEIARPLDHRGAHVAGYNHRALGICLVGGIDEAGEPENNFLPEQFEALVAAIFFVTEVYPEAKIVGHRDLDSGKACPSFDAQAWAHRHGFPVP